MNPDSLDNTPEIPVTSYQDIFMARQPVFMGRKDVWGYELLYRNSFDAACAVFEDGDAATLDVTANICLWPFRDISSKTRILVNFPEKSILEEVPLALPSSQTVVQVQSGVSPSMDLLHALESLRAAGFGIALDDYTNNDHAQRLLPLCDLAIVDLDALAQDPEQVLEAAKKLGVTLLAKKIETLATLEKAEALGCSLFQGFFFKHPENLRDRALSSLEITRIKLFEILERPDPNYDLLSKTIEADVAISYRLLRYLNCPHFSFPRKITSIKQATVLLGWKQLRNWLRVIILTELTPPDRTSELPLLSSLRARFFEALALEAGRDDGDSLFLLGLFSLLEPLLGLPMKSVIDYLPLADEVKNALCEGKGEYAGWLELVNAYEVGNWGLLEQCMERMGLNPVIVARAYAESLEWSNSLLSHHVA